LKLGRYYESITDASISIERKPSIKAHARRAAAWAALKEHILAVEDYKQALEFEPKNLGLWIDLDGKKDEGINFGTPFRMPSRVSPLFGMFGD